MLKIMIALAIFMGIFYAASRNGLFQDEQSNLSKDSEHNRKLKLGNVMIVFQLATFFAGASYLALDKLGL